MRPGERPLVSAGIAAAWDVPDEVAVLGVANDELACRLSDPALRLARERCRNFAPLIGVRLKV